jgi:hypothetical protein
MAYEDRLLSPALAARAALPEALVDPQRAARRLPEIVDHETGQRLARQRAD